MTPCQRLVSWGMPTLRLAKMEHEYSRCCSRSLGGLAGMGETLLGMRNGLKDAREVFRIHPMATP